MTYTINEALSDSEFTNPEHVPAVFRQGPRRIESITIHHWGVFGQTHDGVVNFFLHQSFTTSAHFVVSDGRIDCLVSPKDAAWAAGNAYGNTTSIHIECRPEATEGDYKTVAWLVNWLRNVYGPSLPLIPHRYWQNTACPGIWDLNKIDRLARAVDIAPAPAPPAPAPMQPRVFPDSDIHWVVEPGDTLFKIQRYYGGPTVTQIAAYNNIDPNQLKVGQKIWIPGPLIWIIEAPDTIRSIAAYYGLDPSYLAAINGLAGPDVEIYIGNYLIIKR
jgi:N-acetylmuramoyl-L-alanine amidase